MCFRERGERGGRGWTEASTSLHHPTDTPGGTKRLLNILICYSAGGPLRNIGNHEVSFIPVMRHLRVLPLSTRRKYRIKSRSVNFTRCLFLLLSLHPLSLTDSHSPDTPLRNWPSNISCLCDTLHDTPFCSSSFPHTPHDIPLFLRLLRYSSYCSALFHFFFYSSLSLFFL